MSYKKPLILGAYINKCEGGSPIVQFETRPGSGIVELFPEISPIW